MIHFDFEDRYQDELVVGSAISRIDRAVVSVVLHGLIILVIIFGGRLALFRPSPEELERRRLEQQQEERNRQRLVFVQPRVDRPAPKAPPRPELSDLNRKAEAPEVAKVPNNPLPFSKGNSAERIEAANTPPARTEDPLPPQPQPSRQAAAQFPEGDRGPRPRMVAPPSANDTLRNAIRNYDRYAPKNETFNNPQGGATDPGQAIQFDTKGVEFGPWVRRFVERVKRNWFVPTAAMTFHGHVVLQFNIHRDGHITDVIVAQPSDIPAFNRAAYDAILGSNPVEPLPAEYPDEHAFFTVTFYYNEPLN